MAIKYIDGRRLKGIFITASVWLLKHREILNQLNVYPVPDGDTGTNMSMTLKAIQEELEKLDEDEDVDTIAKIISEAAIMGARGNSGTILSQILYGFLKSILGKEKVYAKEIAAALNLASETAYKAVSNPVEGTILTIVRRVGEAANEYVKTSDDLIGLVEEIRKVAAKEVEKTQDTLPKLKEAGVVDAGAKGFYYILEGFEKFIKEGEITREIAKKVITKEIENIFEKVADEEIKYKYCTEFIIRNEDIDSEELKSKLSTFGDSLVIGRGTNIIKAHIHSNNPGIVLEYALTLGELSNIKIENMSIQHTEMKEVNNNEEEDKNDENAKIYVNKKINKTRGVILVADTKEIADIFIEKGASCVIVGGQTNNPSVKDIERALEKVNSKEIYIFPNNKNIILSVKVAKDRNTQKNIKVIETKSMLEGFYLLKNIENVEQAINIVHQNISVEITKAIKDTKSEDVLIKKDDYITLLNGKIVFSHPDLKNNIDFVNKSSKEKGIQNVLVVRGKDGTDQLDGYIKEKFTDGNLTIYTGNQENYPYYLYFDVGKPQNTVLKEKIAVVVDSVSDIENWMIKYLPVWVIPLKVNFGDDKYFKEDVEITRDEFWRKIVKEKIVPKTSQPSPAEFMELYKKIFSEGYTKIISIHASSKKSGVSQTAKVAVNMMERSDDIKIIDTGLLSLAIGILAVKAGEMATQGMKLDEIVEKIERKKSDSNVTFVVNDLQYLKRGGRIGRAASVVGEFFHLKPILTMKNGEVVSIKKISGIDKAVSYLQEKVKSEALKGKITVMVASGGDDKITEYAEGMERYIRNCKNVNYLGKASIGAVVGSHTGPVYGVMIYHED